MNNKEYDQEVHKLLYHVSEMIKIQAKLIEENKTKADLNDERLYKIEKDVAIMRERMKFKRGKYTQEVKEKDSTDYTLIGIVLAAVIAGAKIVYEFIINKPN